jgi:hypothetical protein
MNASEKLVTTGLERAFNAMPTAGHIIPGSGRQVTATAGLSEVYVID